MAADFQLTPEGASLLGDFRRLVDALTALPKRGVSDVLFIQVRQMLSMMQTMALSADVGECKRQKPYAPLHYELTDEGLEIVCTHAPPHRQRV